jgi:GNAT superfamily N-acetyltransferase
MNEPVQIRRATPQDAAALLGLIRELAVYERLLDKVVATERDIGRALSGDPPAAAAFLAEAAGEAIGFALYFRNFSTFLGRPGIYLEDLYVRPAWRHAGLGRRLLARRARAASDSGADRLDWAVLDWNAPAIDFYERIGARPLADWRLYRLEGPALAALADDEGVQSMPEPRMQALLEDLQREVAENRELTDAQREELEALKAQIERRLRRREDAPAGDPAVGLRDQIDAFERSHPTLTLTLGRILDALNKMGI